MGKFVHGWQRMMGWVLLVNSLNSGCTGERDVSPEIRATELIEAPVSSTRLSELRLPFSDTLSAESIRRIATENLRLGMEVSDVCDVLDTYKLLPMITVAGGGTMTQSYGMDDLSSPSLTVTSEMDFQNDFRVTGWDVSEGRSPISATEKTVGDDLRLRMTQADVDEALAKRGLLPGFASANSDGMSIFYFGMNPDGVCLNVHFGADDSKGEQRLVKWEIVPVPSK